MGVREGEWDQLRASLPASGDSNGDLDVAARAVLHLLLDAMDARTDGAEAVEFDVRLCPNCGANAIGLASPYCSECCKQQAAFVRQMRESIANGSLLDPHRQTMKGEVLWRLLGGGLPRRLALVPDKARERVFKREEGKCELCGAPATRIDNTGSG